MVSSGHQTTPKSDVLWGILYVWIYRLDLDQPLQVLSASKIRRVSESYSVIPSVTAVTQACPINQCKDP